MPTSTHYITKLTELQGADFFGKLYYREEKDDPDRSGYWAIEGGGQLDNLEEWLERFDGKTVRLSITTMARDEAHLLPKGEKPDDPAP